MQTVETLMGSATVAVYGLGVGIILSFVIFGMTIGFGTREKLPGVAREK
jgi:hypothetical protein